MKRARIINRPTRISDMSFEDYTDNDEWQNSKALRLQLRRWRKLKHQLS